MDRITVQPREVRGLGDILSPKSASDFEEYLGTLTSSTDTVNGASMTVYTLAYASNVASVSLTSNKSILSYADSESATLSATVLDSDSEPLENVTVEFFKGSTSLGTADTNSSGVATKTYASAGSGDISVTAKAGGVTSTGVTIEDCNYYNTTEVSRTTTQGSTIYDDNLSQSLPTNCEISFDIYSNNSSSGEHRFFLLPKTQYSSGTTQPSYAVYMDLLGSNKANLGKRDNGATSAFVSGFSCTGSTYHTVKIVKTGTSVEIYVDDTLKTTQTLSWIGNYNDYTISMMRWSASGTSKVKNVKFKPV